MFERLLISITRHRVKSLLTATISLLAVLFFFIYLSSLIGNIDEFNSLGKSLPIDGQVTNINGTYVEDIRISAAKVQKLERTNEIENVRKTTILYLDSQDLVLEEEEATTLIMMRREYYTLYGVNDAEAVPGFEEATYYDDYSNSVLGTDEAICLVEENHMKEQNLQIGDTYINTLYRKRYKDAEYTYVANYVGKLEAKIIGTFKASISEDASDIIQVIAPIRYIREIYRENDVNYSVHSMSFTLKNGFNVNSFKEQALDIGFVSRNPLSDGFGHDGEALVLYDESFIKTAEQLQKNISLMQIFAPIIFIIVAFIGFLTSYLLLQSRQNEFAIMRSLGQSKASVFFSLLLEAVILALIGGLAGSIIGIIIGTDLLTALVILGIFIILYSLGTVIALLFLNRFSVMEVLTKADE